MKTFFILLILLLSNLLISQPLMHHKPSDKITFEHITEDNGLSSNIVTCIMQDSKGYMWFGTMDGLNKYDGYNFTIYKNDPDDPYSIKQNHISVIYEDKSGILWFGTREKHRKGKLKGSLNRFQREKEQFIHYINDPADSLSLINSYITSICEDNFGDLWIGTRKGLNKFNRDKEQFIFHNLDINDQTGITNRINVLLRTHQRKSNELWIGTDNRVFRKTNDEMEKFIAHKPDRKNAYSLSSRNILSICEDKLGNLWFGTDGGGLNKFDAQKKQFIHYRHDPKNPNTLSHNQVQSVYFDNSGILWIATNGGLNKFNIEKEQFVHYKHDPRNPYSLSNDKVLSIFEDNSGVIWIGTSGGGINKINKQKDQFTHYKYDSTYVNWLSNNRIWSVYEDSEGFIWLGTHDGLNIFNVSNEIFLQYRNEPGNHFSISKKKIWSICEDELGNIWLGTLGGGLNKFDRKTRKFKHFKNILSNSNSLSNNFVRIIFKDNKGTFWIGTHGGLNKFDPKTDRFTQYKYYSNDPYSKNSNKVISIYETTFGDKDELWIGTQGGGLNKFDRATEQFMNYKYDPGNSKSLSNNNVLLIYEDKTGELWISTLGGLNKFDRKEENFTRFKFDEDTLANDVCKVILEDKSGILWVGNNSGLYKYDQEKGNFIHYDEKYGVHKVRIDAILEDDDGYLWISCEKYIIKFNPLTETSIIYKIQNGLKNRIQIQNSYTKTRSGNFLFAGQNGFIFFNPNRIKDNTIIPTIALTGFQIFNKSVNIRKDSVSDNSDSYLLEKHISENKKIEIPYDKNVFSIEFSSLDFRDPKKNKYAYKLEGVDPDWVYTDASRRFATYNQLNPGEYIFHVKGSNNDGIWNEEGTSLKIIITPLWWQTIWFRAFIIVVIIGVIIFTFYNRINALKKKHQVQEEFSRKLINSQELDRKRIASALHDSHGQNLLVISNEMQNFVLEHQEHKGELKPVTEIVQESIDEIRNISYDLHPHQLDKLGLVKTIKSMVKKVSGSTDVKFELSIDKIDDLFEKKVEINLYRIIQEAMNNIIKHSQATEVNIDIKKEFQSVNIDINDNGKGFNKKEKLKEVKGLGLSGMQERANLINGKINFESQMGSGTTINISIPISTKQ